MNVGRLLPITVAVIGISCLLFISVVALVKVHRLWTAATSRKLLSVYRPALLAVASDEDEDGQAKAMLIAAPNQIWERLRSHVIAFLPKVRGTAADDLIDLLTSHGEIDRSIKMLASRSGFRRARGAYLLGLVRDPNLGVLMIPLLNDRNPDVRLVTARALGEIGEASAALDVLGALRTTRGRNDLPAWVAVEALLAMGAQIAPALENGLRSRVAAVRNVCSQVAGHGTFFSAAPQLGILLDSDNEISVRNSAAMALGLIGDDASAVILARNTNSFQPTELRRTCATALGDLGRTDGLNTLEHLLSDQDRRLAQISADALIRIGSDGVTKLEQVATGQDPSAHVARGALELAELRGQLIYGPAEL